MKYLKWIHQSDSTSLKLQNLTLRQKLKIVQKLQESYSFEIQDEPENIIIFTDLSEEMKNEIIELITLISP